MQFPKFDAKAYLEGKPSNPKPEESLGALGGLGGHTQEFEKKLASLNADQREAYEERAAIMEYDGGMSREEAEWLTLDNVIYVQFGRKP